MGISSIAMRKTWGVAIMLKNIPVIKRLTVAPDSPSSSQASPKKNRENWLEEFDASGISPELALANVEWVSGDEAIEFFLADVIAKNQANQTYLTAENSRLVKRYQFLADGGWAARPELCPVPYLKPINPRRDYQDPEKIIKYETPRNSQALPLFPEIPITFIERACIAHNIDPLTLATEIKKLWEERNNPTQTTLSGYSSISKKPGAGSDSPRRSQSEGSRPKPLPAPYGQNSQESNSNFPKSISTEASYEFLANTLETCNSAIGHYLSAGSNNLFWPAWAACGGPILITEGLKKALASIENGLPAIALRGVSCWNIPNYKTLKPELASIATGTILIAFDQDEKPKTRSNVSAQAKALGDAIEALGGTARFLRWDGAVGKGLDDFLMAAPWQSRGSIVIGLVAEALDLQTYRRAATIAKAAAMRAYAPVPSAQRETTGEYLPQLPPVRRGAIQWLDAPMNSGKTVRMGADWVRPWVASGGLAVVLSPLNSLGAQTAQDWDLPHIHDYKTDSDSRQALEADISQRGGIVACFNSVHRVLSLLHGDRPLLLIIDEAAQVLTDACEGGTLKGNWAERWGQFIELAKRASAIALAEAGLDQATIDLVKALSGFPLVLGNRHHKQIEHWKVGIYRATPLSGFWAEILSYVMAGNRAITVSSSQVAGKRLEQAAIDHGITVIRIDSETNESGRFREFFENPDQWIRTVAPQLLILSPSAKTGLSIEGGVSVDNAYFGKVFGYFPSLDTDTHLQLLGRYRPAVPRVIWCPAFINPSPGEKPNRLAITDEIAGEAANYAKVGGFEQSESNNDESAIAHFLAYRRSRRWAQKIAPDQSLAERLTASGHKVEIFRNGNRIEEIETLWNEIKERLARADSELFASLTIDPEINTLKWANEVLKGIDSTYIDRCKANKLRTISRFSGLDWNCPELWYAGFFSPGIGDNCGPLAPGAALWAEASHYQTLWAEDIQESKSILTKRLKASHLLPTNGPRAALAAIFRPLVEKLLAAGEVAPGGAVEAEIKKLALTYTDNLARYWRLSIADEQSDTAIANKIIKKFGLTLTRSRRVSIGGKRAWIYSLEASPTWRNLVAARELALAGGEGTKVLNSSFNKFVPDNPPPDPQSPPNEGRGPTSPQREDDFWAA